MSEVSYPETIPEVSTLVEQGSNDAQKKRFKELKRPAARKYHGESLEEANGVALDTRGIFLQLFDKIDSAESKNEDATRGLISSYFDFGEALYGEEGARALVKSEVRKEIPET